MHPNAQLIEEFYSAFKQKDFSSGILERFYAEEATFSDEVFVGLNAREARAMWQMLVKRGKDLQLEFSDVKADDFKGEAQWIATYSFSASGRKVVNKIKAEFEFKNGRVVRHADHFDFPQWSAQALGFVGKLFGRTKWLQNKVRRSAREGLDKYMSQIK